MMNHYPDELFMKRALLLAEQGRGFASPNPIVGACIVKGKKLIAEGYHACFGGPHAEVEAIRRAGQRAKGATLYVTLEPCSTWGKTPPCTRAIEKSGIRRVVVGALDPNPKHAGRGIQLLKQKKISVQVGVLQKDVEEQIQGFRKWVFSQKPFVTLKMAESLDGKIASRSGDSRWITGSEARRFVHGLRSRVDGIVVGKNTGLRDNPSLTVRYVKSKWQPWRFILDTRGELKPSQKVFHGKSPTVLVCGDRFLKKVAVKFQNSNATILSIPEQNGRLDLSVFLKKLGRLGITSLLIEGGGEVSASFLEKQLVDRVYFVIAPTIIGGRDAKTSVEGKGVHLIRQSWHLKNVSIVRCGSDFVIQGDF
ncbi:MAG: bifunctional diaminohydroxyphosphoribosylaminopyrimidine deaminase/5-amino-6-(5-phosphoribosylamino)uracil reductase RibD [Candidatus Omnitrophica bacterium]|nr:bifunctional diaminohydroxyphosphoribosylaminopyrimidine deaminase/5-amino-6-(5-phosphoribosylamino)uracil reductase RibD [Candidatus Omnitrophota bacterium]